MKPAPGDSLLVFDCDGVLVDSEPLAGVVLNEALNELGVRISLAESAARFTGLSTASWSAAAARMLGSPLPEGFVRDVERRTIEAFRGCLRPVRDIEAVLQMDVPRCVASSGSHRRIRTSLELTGLDRWFPDGTLFSGDDVARGKPAPDLFLHVARATGFAPAQCIVIEDSVPGVRAAVAAGMRVFGYAERTEPRALRSAGATVITRMSELAALLARPPIV